MRVCIVWGWRWWWLFLFLLFPANIRSLRNDDTTTTTTRNRDDVIACHLVRPKVALEGGNDDALNVAPAAAPIQCWTNHPAHSYRVSYDIDLPGAWQQSHQHVINGGDALVYVRNADINDSLNRIMIDKNDTSYSVSSYKATRQQPQLRSLQQSTPPPPPTILRILVVRVVDVDGQAPLESKDHIEGAIFGTGAVVESRSANVVTQLAAMSHDQLSVVPASWDTLSSDHNGVVEVTVSLAVNGSGFFRELLPALLNATEAVIGGSMDETADAYLFCLPDGAKLVGQTGWKAITMSNEPYSFFQRSYCTGISAVIHELGHSIFGFSHSSTRGEEYGDNSCYMGFVDNTLGYPLKAFNAHKHWLTGWFDNRTETLNTTALPWGGRRLVSFVDYRHEALLTTDVALITIGDLFIQYDVSKGYNIHSLSPANVLITQANDTISRSVAVANLSIGESFIYQGVSAEASNGIIIDVCDIGSANETLDYSIISIYLNDGEQQSTCYNAESITSSLPSSFVSAVPSSIYSSVPSNVPRNVPLTPIRNAVASSRPSDGPASADNSPVTKTSGIEKYHGRTWLPGVMSIILLTILHPLVLQYC